MSQKYHCIIPQESLPRKVYYNRYVRYMINILLENNVNIQYKGVNLDARYCMTVNDQKVVIDYSDHPHIDTTKLECKAYFKFHYREVHKEFKNVHPFAPTSFYNWEQYRALKMQIIYKCNNNVVLNLQKPYGNATNRRNHVRDILYKRYKLRGNLVYSPHFAQVDYWKMINNCLVHVFVPGCYNDMLDRGHIQYLAFGCCTVAPPIMDLLPYDSELIPGIHYIQCKSNYSDLIEKIDWCKNHRKECIEIGKNAQKLFDQSCTPKRLWKWILSKVEK